MENMSYEELKAILDTLSYENNKLRKEIEDEKKKSRRLNLDAQRWFDIAMDYLHKK